MMIADCTEPGMLNILNRQVRPVNDIDAAQQWLTGCLDGHPSCASHPPLFQSPGSPHSPFLPTRLINVGMHESDHPFIDDSTHRRGSYFTLSYKWGSHSSSTVLTTRATLEEHKLRLPLSSLGQTFKDAIELTRRMEVRYLWIDSLCIIQDDHEDKAREIPQMADIYENCLVMLSACVGEDPTTGLFNDRPKRNVVQLPHRNEAGQTLGQYFVSDWKPPSFEEDVTKGSLSSRGW